MIGKTINHYQITAKLGAGGMGEVYLATDTKLDRQVALKFLPESLKQDPEARERLLREAKAASQLSHPNIVTIYSVEQTQGRDFIVMEYVKGRSLAAFIASAKRPLDEIVGYAIQIADGLEKAHKVGVVHRDLKPDNVLIDTDNRLKICDFGLAKLKGAGKLTKDHSTLGTARYMSPEQAQGEAVDHRSDIWSFGVLLYEMLAGRPPFAGDYDQAIIYGVLNEEPPPVDDSRPGIPVRLVDLIGRTLQKEPAARFQHIRDMRAELYAIQKDIRALDAAGRSAEAKSQPSIAVLPFADMSPGGDNEYFSDGLAEELINGLTRIRDLHVVARTSSFSFKGKDIDIREIGRKLNVDAVLEGSVRKAGNRLRITAQLIKVADGYHLWSERFDREMDDIFAVQDEISLVIVDKLKGTLLKEERAALVKRDTVDPEAYNHYLKGLYHLNRRTEADFRKSLDYFTRAVERDPEYAKAHAGLANAYAIGGGPGYHFFPPHECYPEAEQHAERALAIDPELPEALNALAMSHLNYRWEWATAGDLLDRSLRLNPNLADTHHFHAEYLSVVCRPDEALAAERRAQELDPLSLIIACNVGNRYFGARQYERAASEIRRVLEMDPHFLVAHVMLAMVLWQMGRSEEALAICEAFPAASEIPMLHSIQGMAYADMRKRDEALAIIRELQNQSAQRYIFPVFIALIYSSLGDIDSCFAWLEKAYEARDTDLIHIKADPFSDPLRDDPRFHSLVQRMGFPE